MAGSEVREFAGRELTLTSLDKPYFPKVGLTKGDLLAYFEAVSVPLLRCAGNRPVLLQRFPNGVGGKSFFQKRIPDSAPEWLQTSTVQTVNGTPSRALVLADLAHVLWAVNQGAFILHLWPFRVPGEHVDELRIDLDPVPGITFDDVRSAALVVRDWFESRGVTSYVKTSGSKGLHVYVPLDGSSTGPQWTSFDVRGAAVTVARSLAREFPDNLTDAWWKEERGKRVFIDFNQNAPHKTVFGAWSVRARVGAQVSVPISWEQLAHITNDDLTVSTVPAFVAEHGDAWETMYDQPQDITALVEEFRDGLETIGDAPWPPVYPKQPYEPPRVSPSRAKKSD